jgi:hypothetical protein
LSIFLLIVDQGLTSTAGVCLESKCKDFIRFSATGAVTTAVCVTRDYSPQVKQLHRARQMAKSKSYVLSSRPFLACSLNEIMVSAIHTSTQATSGWYYSKLDDALFMWGMGLRTNFFTLSKSKREF